MRKIKSILDIIHKGNMKRLNYLMIGFLVLNILQYIIDTFAPHLSEMQNKIMGYVIVIQILIYILFIRLRNKIPAFFEYLIPVLVFSSLYPFFIISENPEIVLLMFFNIFLFFSILQVTRGMIFIGLISQAVLFAGAEFFNMHSEILSEYFRLTTLWVIIISVWAYKYFVKTYNDLHTHDELKKINNEYKKEVEVSKKNEKELMQMNKVKESMLEINNRMLMEDDLEGFLNYILKKVVETMEKVENGIFWVIEDDYLVVKAAVGYKSDDIINKKFKIGPKLRIRILSAKECSQVLINDVENYPGLKKQIEGISEHENNITRSFISTPVFKKNELYGFANFKSCMVNAFSESDVFLMKYLGEQISIAIELNENYSKARYLSVYDALTGFKNRWQIYELEKADFKRWKRIGSKVIFVMADFDNLKTINDTFGHSEGDRYFRYFCEIVNSKIRSSDIIIRMGGDEFLMIFFDINVEKLENKLEEINSELAYKRGEEDMSYNLRKISYGFSELFKDSEDFIELINMSDNEMYKKKNNSRDEQKNTSGNGKN